MDLFRGETRVRAQRLGLSQRGPLPTDKTRLLFTNITSTMTDTPYAPPPETGEPLPLPRSVYMVAHVAILIALVVLLWPVLGLLGGFRMDGQHPKPDGTLLSTIQAAGVGYRWLIWALTLVTDVALWEVLRRRQPRPVRQAWFAYSTLWIGVNSVIVYTLYMTIFRYDL
jgi:hypothetical protein